MVSHYIHMSFIFGQHHGAAAASSLKERFLNSCCCCFREMNVRTVGRCFTSSFGWLILTCGALYFVYFAQLMVVSPTTSYQQQQLPASFSNHLLAIGSSTQQVVVNRSRCCVMSGRQQQTADVCDRPNCTRNCPDPVQIPISIDDSRANAFFLETSGSGGLNIRQACAVESLAFHNPNLNVNVLFVGGQINASSSNSSIVDARKLAETYANIHPIGLDLDEYLAGTLLEKWYHCTDWRTGPYHVSHLSDGLRFLTLNKYGGYYFDLDVLMVRSVTQFRNFVAVENSKDMGSGVIHADLGSPLMQLSVQDFAANYSAGLWTHNGPLLLLRVLRRWCNVDDLQSMDYIRCQGFHVLPSSSFCPVHYTQLGRLFDNQQQQQRRPDNETSTDETTMTRPEWLTDQVVGIHTWNKLSYNRPIHKNSTQTYNRLARHHCPLTYSLAPHVF